MTDMAKLAKALAFREPIKDLLAAEICPYGDPHCPCPDGGACHYEWVGGTKPWPAPKRLALLPPGRCAYCDRMRTEGAKFFPSHTPSNRCESHRRAHCSCDTCF